MTSNRRDGVSTHQLRDCLLNRWFRRRSKKTSKPPVTGPVWSVNSPYKRTVMRNFFSIWWRLHDQYMFTSQVWSQMNITTAMLSAAYLEDRIQFGHQNSHVVLCLKNISTQELYIGPIQKPWLSEVIHNSRHFNRYSWTGPHFEPMQKTYLNLSNRKHQLYQ